MKIILAALLLFTGCGSSSNKELTQELDGLSYSTYGKGQVETRGRVVVLDSGLDEVDLNKDFMCKDVSSVDLYGDHYDHHGHGTSIVSIISKYMNKSKYCITMFRASRNMDKSWNYKPMVYLIPRIATNLVMVNISIESKGAHELEYKSLEVMTHYGVVVNVAAGNSGFNLDWGCGVFPACYAYGLNKNFNVVGTNGNYSNYGGPVNFVVKDKLRGKPKMRGTSQGTAYLTGQMLIK